METAEAFALCMAVVIGTVLAVVFGRSAWRGLFPGRWQKVPARVVRAYVEGTRHNGAVRYSSIVEYAYRFDAHEWWGTGTVWGGVTSRSNAQDALASYPAGHAFMVEVYRPDPRESRIGRSRSFMAAVATVFGLVLVGFALSRL